MLGLRDSRRFLEAVLLLLEGDVIMYCRRGHGDFSIVWCSGLKAIHARGVGVAQRC